MNRHDMGDLLDDFIEIGKDVDAIKDGLSEVASGISVAPADDDATELWDPDAYHAHIRIRGDACLCSGENPIECDLCEKACPTDALRVQDRSLLISGRLCLGCGLCLVSCPAGALVANGLEASRIYDDIAAAASTGKMAYVTCARANTTSPPPGVIVLPCVALLSDEMWFSLLVDYPNIAVYLPPDICSACPVEYGERRYGAAIARAETWASSTVGYECGQEDLMLDRKRSVERREFMDAILARELSGSSKLRQLSRHALDVYDQVDRHRRALARMRSQVEKKSMSAGCRHRVPDVRLLFLVAIEEHPQLAGGIEVETVEVDWSACDSCGLCQTMCPTHALGDDDIPDILPAVCLACGLCSDICPNGAIHQATATGDKLVSSVLG